MRKSAFWITLLACLAAPLAWSAPQWEEGKNYFVVTPAQPTSVPKGKIEVLEVFSYGCPACAQFAPIMHQLKHSLPSNAEIAYLPAAFLKQEDWPMFQRAFCTAQALGIVDRTHDAMFDAVWQGGDLSTTDPLTGQLKNPLPKIEDAARFYNHAANIPVEKFLKVAASPAIQAKMKEDSDRIIDYQVDRTPTIIVNGKYRLHVASAGGTDELIELVNWLIAKESGKTAK